MIFNLIASYVPLSYKHKTDILHRNKFNEAVYYHSNERKISIETVCDIRFLFMFSWGGMKILK